MPINPIDSLARVVQKKVKTVSNSKIAAENLQKLYGNNPDCRYIDVLKSKNGTVCAVGKRFKASKGINYAYAIKLNGDHIQTVADRGIQTKNGMYKDVFIQATTKNNGKSRVQVTDILFDEDGIFAGIKKYVANLSRKQNDSSKEMQTNIISFDDYVKKHR